MSDEPEFPTPAMVEIASRHTKNLLAEFANEGIKGVNCWQHRQPRQVIHETIIAALMDAEAQRRDAEAKSRA